MLEEIDPETLRTLKFHQYWTICYGMLKLRRALHRSDNQYLRTIGNFANQDEGAIS